MMDTFKDDLRILNKIMKNEKAHRGYAEIRIRKNQHGALMREFMDIMAEFDSIKDTYKQHYTRKLSRTPQYNRNEASVSVASMEG